MSAFAVLANFYSKSFLLGTLYTLVAYSENKKHIKVPCVCRFHHTNIFMTDLEGFLGIEPREKEYQIFNMQHNCCVCYPSYALTFRDPHNPILSFKALNLLILSKRFSYCCMCLCYLTLILYHILVILSSHF